MVKPKIKARVLYVDDEESLVFLASRTLERVGHQVRGFNDPQAALEAFKQAPHGYDLVVSDVSMPGMNGFDLARAVLEIRPDLPVVITSGYLRAEDYELAERIGIRKLILKPDTIEALSVALTGLLA